MLKRKPKLEHVNLAQLICIFSKFTASCVFMPINLILQKNMMNKWFELVSTHLHNAGLRKENGYIM
jgi:hypothetical protein